jgi:hypothetical protein
VKAASQPTIREVAAGDRFGRNRAAGGTLRDKTAVDHYSGEGRPAGYADLAREVVRRNSEVIRCDQPSYRAGRQGGHRQIPIVASGAAKRGEFWRDADSLLERDRFELSVPPTASSVTEGYLVSAGWAH